MRGNSFLNFSLHRCSEDAPKKRRQIFARAHQVDDASSGEPDGDEDGDELGEPVKEISCKKLCS